MSTEESCEEDVSEEGVRQWSFGEGRAGSGEGSTEALRTDVARIALNGDWGGVRRLPLGAAEMALPPPSEGSERISKVSTV